MLLADAEVTQQAADGRLGAIEDDPTAVNGAACGEPVLYAYRRTGDERGAPFSPA